MDKPSNPDLKISGDVFPNPENSKTADENIVRPPHLKSPGVVD